MCRALGCRGNISEDSRLMIHFLQGLIAAVVWLIANVVYVDMKRKGLRGFTRFAAFWAGTPTTWITFFAMPEGKHPKFEPHRGAAARGPPRPGSPPDRRGNHGCGGGCGHWACLGTRGASGHRAGL